MFSRVFLYVAYLPPRGHCQLCVSLGDDPTPENPIQPRRAVIFVTKHCTSYHTTSHTIITVLTFPLDRTTVANKRASHEFTFVLGAMPPYFLLSQLFTVLPPQTRRRVKVGALAHVSEPVTRARAFPSYDNIIQISTLISDREVSNLN